MNKIDLFDICVMDEFELKVDGICYMVWCNNFF